MFTLEFYSGICQKYFHLLSTYHLHYTLRNATYQIKRASAKAPEALRITTLKRTLREFARRRQSIGDIGQSQICQRFLGWITGLQVPTFDGVKVVFELFHTFFSKVDLF